MSLAANALLLLAVLVACESTDAVADAWERDASDAVSDTVEDAGSDTGPGPDVVFAVSVTEWVGTRGAADSAYAGAGRTWGGELPSVVAAAAGDCVFVQPVDPPFCDPPCDLGTVCVADPSTGLGASGTCGQPVRALGAGDIVIEGLKVGCTLVPETQYHYYQPIFSPEPVDGDVFDDGDRLTATAPGDDVPAFTVSTRGVARLETSLACPPVAEPGAALDVSWTPGSQAGDRISFVMQSGNHGTQFSRLLCETSDTGHLVVDAGLLAAYRADWHPVESWGLTRTHEDVVDLGEVRVTFTAASRLACTW